MGQAIHSVNDLGLRASLLEGGGRVVFVYDELNMGGVETYIVRLSNWLVDRGFAVTILLARAGALDHLLSSQVARVVGITDGLVYLRKSRLPGQAKAALAEADLLFAFDPVSTMRLIELMPSCSPFARVMHGIFHPRIYFFRDGSKSVAGRVQQYVFCNLIDQKSVVFMNEACRVAHEKRFEISFSEANIVPLPISEPAQEVLAERSRRIVSVGRLTAFKTYNIFMMDVVQDLIERGFEDVRWDVYGSGPLESEMLTQIKSRSLESHVLLRGEIPYEKFAGALDGAEVFVGMGTALIEAGSYGIPCVPAVDSADGYGYGYLHDLDEYSVGERACKKPEIPFSDLIAAVFDADVAAYEGLCAEERKHAQRFFIGKVGERFLATAAEAQVASKCLRPDGGRRLIYSAAIAYRGISSLISAAGVRFLRAVLPHGALQRLRQANRQRHSKKNRSELSQ